MYRILLSSGHEWYRQCPVLSSSILMVPGRQVKDGTHFGGLVKQTKMVIVLFQLTNRSISKGSFQSVSPWWWFCVSMWPLNPNVWTPGMAITEMDTIYT